MICCANSALCSNATLSSFLITFRLSLPSNYIADLMKTSLITWGQFVRTVCVVSLVLLSFAHRPVISTSQNDMSPFELAAYTLPDGSGLTFCLSGGDGGEAGVERPCEFCRIAGSLVLPMPSEDVDADGLPVPVLFIVAVDMHKACAGFPPAAPPRGPPIVRI